MDEMDRKNVGEDPTLLGNDVARNESLGDRDVTARPVRDNDDPTTADGVFSLAWLVIALPAAGAAILLIGGAIAPKKFAAFGHVEQPAEFADAAAQVLR